jgi:hypothetical protein
LTLLALMRHGPRRPAGFATGEANVSTNINDMGEEELRARAEAAMLGRLRIIQDAIEALISVSPNPDSIRLRLEESLAAIKKEMPEDSTLGWVPRAIAAGANPLGKRFIDACGAPLTARH